MSETARLTLTDMGHGGVALGRDRQNRVIFVPGAIPGEKVRVELTETKKRYAQARLMEVIKPSSERVKPPGPAVGPHGGYTYQHMTYDAQLKYKKEVTVDQLKRIGGLEPKVHDTIPSPQQWAYDLDVVLSPTEEGGMGFWSADEEKVLPVERVPSAVPLLQELVEDFDLDLPNLRKMTLRAGYDESLLVALEVDDVEPPSLHVDFPVSVTIVLPDLTTANLIGENYITRRVGERLFQVSAGCFFYGNRAVTETLVETVSRYAAVATGQTVWELYCGVGTLTGMLAERAGAVHGMDINEDAVGDAALNLDDTENVHLYHGWAEQVVPMLDVAPDVVVMDPPMEGVDVGVLELVAGARPRRIVYVSGDVATLARDGKRLANMGYTLHEVQPLDMLPQTHHIHTVGVWRR